MKFINALEYSRSRGVPDDLMGHAMEGGHECCLPRIELMCRGCFPDKVTLVPLTRDTVISAVAHQVYCAECVARLRDPE